MDNGKSIGILVGIIAVVAIVGGVMWSNNNNDTKDNNKNANNTAQTETPVQAEATTPNIVGLASDTPTLSTLVAAVKAADLVETLSGDGPFTVFAPTNSAFEALPAGTLDSLLLPENKDTLASILTYHVVAGKVMAADLSNGQEITTVQGAKLVVKITDGKVYLVDAKGSEVMVETADVAASNGVVHIIGGVLLPS